MPLSLISSVSITGLSYFSITASVPFYESQGFCAVSILKLPCLTAYDQIFIPLQIMLSWFSADHQASMSYCKKSGNKSLAINRLSCFTANYQAYIPHSQPSSFHALLPIISLSFLTANH